MDIELKWKLSSQLWSNWSSFFLSFFPQAFFASQQPVKITFTSPPTCFNLFLCSHVHFVSVLCCAWVLKNSTYAQALAYSGLDTLADRRSAACRKLFSEIVSQPGHKLAHLLPPKHQQHYNLRRSREYTTPRAKTDRFLRTFIPSSIIARVVGSQSSTPTSE